MVRISGGRQVSPKLRQLFNTYKQPDGHLTERWEYFSGNYDEKIRQIITNRWQGRTGAYFQSEVTDYPSDFTLPVIVETDNDALSGEPDVWKNVVRVRNYNPTDETVDPFYLGAIKSFDRAFLTFEAAMPDGGSDCYAGFEINSGGAFTYLACLYLAGDDWKLYFNSAIGEEVLTLATLRHEVSDVTTGANRYARYGLLFDPPFFKLYEAPAGDRDGFPLEETASLLIPEFPGRVAPFFASENTSTDNELRVGNIWCREISPTGVQHNLVDGVTSTNGDQYSDVLTHPEYGKLEFFLSCVTQDVDVKLEYSVDNGSTYYTHPEFNGGAALTLTAGADPVLYSITDPMPYMRWHFTSSVADTHGDLTISMTRNTPVGVGSLDV